MAALSPRLAVDAGPAVPLQPTQVALAEEVRRRQQAGSLTTSRTLCVCGATAASTVVAEVDRHGLELRTVLCGACGTLRADPYLDDAGLRVFYRDYYQELYARASDPTAYFDRQKSYGRRVADAVRRIAPQSRSVVEIGCGAGGALDVLRTEGMEVAGCDHSRELIAFGTGRGIKRLAVGDLGDLVAADPGVRDVDVVYLHHVFEHVSDPALLLETCKSILGPRGAFVAIVPDISRIDAFPFPGGDVRLFLHIAHKYNYSRQGLSMLGERCGYTVEFLEGFESHVAPEMWAIFRPGRRPEQQQPTVAASGAQMLAYLRKTDTRYRFGLLPGYQSGIRSRATRLAKTVMPRSLVRWLSAVKSSLQASRRK
jgi:SAM-dependent methyltransferase